MKYRFVSLMIALICFLPNVVPAQNSVVSTPDLATTIEHLITYVETSGLVFVRNAEKRDGHAAAAHIRSKYDHFKSSITTPQQFIESCASKSMMSGKEYTVILADGSEQPVKDWLLEELARFQGK